MNAIFKSIEQFNSKLNSRFSLESNESMVLNLYQLIYKSLLKEGKNLDSKSLTIQGNSWSKLLRIAFLNLAQAVDSFCLQDQTKQNNPNQNINNIGVDQDPFFKQSFILSFNLLNLVFSSFTIRRLFVSLSNEFTNNKMIDRDLISRKEAIKEFEGTLNINHRFLRSSSTKLNEKTLVSQNNDYEEHFNSCNFNYNDSMNSKTIIERLEIVSRELEKDEQFSKDMLQVVNSYLDQFIHVQGKNEISFLSDERVKQLERLSYETWLLCIHLLSTTHDESSIQSCLEFLRKISLIFDVSRNGFPFKSDIDQSEPIKLHKLSETIRVLCKIIDNSNSDKLMKQSTRLIKNFILGMEHETDKFKTERNEKDNLLIENELTSVIDWFQEILEKDLQLHVSKIVTGIGFFQWYLMNFSRNFNQIDFGSLIFRCLEIIRKIKPVTLLNGELDDGILIETFELLNLIMEQDHLHSIIDDHLQYLSNLNSALENVMNITEIFRGSNSQSCSSIVMDSIQEFLKVFFYNLKKEKEKTQEQQVDPFKMLISSNIAEKISLFILQECCNNEINCNCSLSSLLQLWNQVLNYCSVKHKNQLSTRPALYKIIQEIINRRDIFEEFAANGFIDLVHDQFLNNIQSFPSFVYSISSLLNNESLSNKNHANRKDLIFKIMKMIVQFQNQSQEKEHRLKILKIVQTRVVLEHLISFMLSHVWCFEILEPGLQIVDSILSEDLNNDKNKSQSQSQCQISSPFYLNQNTHILYNRRFHDFDNNLLSLLQFFYYTNGMNLIQVTLNNHAQHDILFYHCMRILSKFEHFASRLKFQERETWEDFHSQIEFAIKKPKPERSIIDWSLFSDHVETAIIHIARHHDNPWFLTQVFLFLDHVLPLSSDDLIGSFADEILRIGCFVIKQFPLDIELMLKTLSCIHHVLKSLWKRRPISFHAQEMIRSMKYSGVVRDISFLITLHRLYNSCSLSQQQQLSSSSSSSSSSLSSSSIIIIPPIQKCNQCKLKSLVMKLLQKIDSHNNNRNNNNNNNNNDKFNNNNNNNESSNLKEWQFLEYHQNVSEMRSQCLVETSPWFFKHLSMSENNNFYAHY